MAKYEILNQKEYVDCETGEVKAIEIAKQFTTKVETDKFYMTFIDYISPLFKLKSDAAKSLLVWMCNNAEFNSGKVILNSGIRKDICNELGITNSTISNNLKKLCELNLISGDAGCYTINPQIFWKGDLKERNKMLKDENIQITFKIG